MRNIAIGVLVVILASIFTQPLVELLNLGRENIVLGSALSNSARSARDRSLEYAAMRDLDAQVNEEKFAEYFSNAFEAAMNVTWTNRGEDDTLLRFRSNDDQFNEIEVRLAFEEELDPEREQIITTVTMEAASDYKFKTNYLKLAKDAGEGVDYQLKEERILVLSVTN